MKLTMLGTSHGVPSSERYCSSYMLEVKDNIYLFDGGAPLIDLLLRDGKELTRVKAFFNTHFHGDHILGATSLFTLFEWYFKKTDIDLFLPDTHSAEALSAFLCVSDNVTLPSERVRFNIIEDGVIFDDGVLRVSAIEVRHTYPPMKSFAFLIETEGKSILYTGDMAKDLHDFPAVAFDRHIELILCECAHCSKEDLLKKAEKCDTDVFIVTHVYPEDKFEFFLAEAPKYKFDLRIAQDGDEIFL